LEDSPGHSWQAHFAAMQKKSCKLPGALIDCAPQRRFGSLFLGRFLPKLGGAARRRHSFFNVEGSGPIILFKSPADDPGIPIIEPVYILI
jgi:hypothetical protein